MDTWDGTVDTSWYDAKNPKTKYEISTAEELAGLAELVNAGNSTELRFKNVTIYLTSDLDLSGQEWTSIGKGHASSPQWAFGGIFDGLGHTITGLYSHKSDAPNGRRGLFGSIYDATIRDVRVTHADIAVPDQDSKLSGMGILVDTMFGSQISRCYTNGTISNGTSTDRSIGGVVGQIYGTGSIVACSSSATITGNASSSYAASDFLGGIVGDTWNANAAVINSCWFDGKIIVHSSSAAVGGILGYSETGAEVTNCLIATTDIGQDSEGNSCWVAYSINKDVTNCVYPADEKYDSAVSNATNQASAGLAVNDFKSPDALKYLQDHAANGVKWVDGVHHPVHEGDNLHISADYSEFETAKSQIPEDLSVYTVDSVSKLTSALDAVPEGASAADQDKVDASVAALEAAIQGLEYKPADYTAVDTAIAKAKALNKDDYRDFSKVDAAIEAVARGKNITEQDQVNAMAKAIENAIADLKVLEHSVTIVWGGDIANTTETVQHGKTFVMPENIPTLEGYTFTGIWYLTKAEDGSLSNPYDFSKPVTEDTTLYAGWKKTSPSDNAEKTPQEQPKNDKEKENSQSMIPQTGDSSLAAIVSLIALGAAAVACGLKLRRS